MHVGRSFPSSPFLLLLRNRSLFPLLFFTLLSLLLCLSNLHMGPFNPALREAEASGSQSSRPAWSTEYVLGQNQDCIVRPFLKSKRQKSCKENFLVQKIYKREGWKQWLLYLSSVFFFIYTSSLLSHVLSLAFSIILFCILLFQHVIMLSFGAL